MIFQLLKQLETDVWFCHEGFYYGFECVIADCSKESINLILKPEYKKYNMVFFKHLPSLLKNSSARMQSELRIYFPPRFAKELNSSRKVTLFTEYAPQIVKHQLNEMQMKFINLQGRSKKHTENWKNITSYEFTSGFDNF